jgi:hypothetical protein
MTYYSRQEWGARPAEAHYLLEKDRVRGVALHWPAMSQKVSGHENVFHLLRNIQNYHMDVKEWSDIAYQIAIDQDGSVYQLRGMRFRSAANGDRTVNELYGAILLVLAIGEKPSRAMIHTTNQKLISYKTFYPHLGNVYGHQDVRPEPTQCPGPLVMDLIHSGRIHV